MSNRINILKELESIAPLLVNAPMNMPYTTPEAYFETFPAEILNQLGLDENHALAPHIVAVSKENPYHLPVGYFDGLAHAVLEKIYKHENAATVPEGYFSSLSDILLGKVRGIEVNEELEDLAPLLNTIDKRPVNFVPQGYFENLAAVPEEEVTAIQEIKVVSINKKKTNWLKYAVAACFTGVIVFTAIKVINKPAIVDSPMSLNFKEKLYKLPDSTIENYLSKEQSVSESANVAYSAVNDDDIKDFLKEFSDEELQQYLKNEGDEIASN
ncbi:MAG: hypothetical protein ABIX01_20385 [Chitinophagaceae bacterium]